MSRRFWASETTVRSATRCSLPPAPELGVLANLGLVLTLALSPVLILVLVLLVLAGEFGEIHE